MRGFKIRQLQKILKVLAGLMLNKYRPGIVGITGSVGKTSTKEAIYAVLRNVRRVRASSGNFNNELGLPLTILGDWQKIKGPFFWTRVIFSSIRQLIFGGFYPEILILEYAAAKPGDIKYLLEIAKPDIGIVTAIGDIPVHVEFYGGSDAVAREKSRLVEVLPAHGFAVLNFDDSTVLDMKERTRAHVMTFGFGENAEIRITNFENHHEDERLSGIAFKLEYGGSFVPVRLDNCFGKAQAYAAAAATCAGLIFGLNLVRISESLLYYQAPPRRMKLLNGIKETFIIDDSYNASPLSMHGAIDTIKDLKAVRKIGVLGDMLEIGKYTIEAHEEIGRLSAKVFDILITIGPRAKFIADLAIKTGMSKKNVFSFNTADEAKIKIQELIKKGDLILVKASRAMQLDKVVEEIRQI